ncbi:MAG: hypothetical protein ACYS26_13025, partial [Planctomycetota bacterium]
MTPRPAAVQRFAPSPSSSLPGGSLTGRASETALQGAPRRAQALVGSAGLLLAACAGPLLTGCAGPGAIGSLGGSSGADVDLLRIDAELSIDADRRLLGVEALYRFQVERAGLRQLEFVYGGPALESVLDGEGRLVPFQQEGERLTLELEEPGEYGSELLLQFSYYGRPRLDFGFAAAGNGESAGYCLGQAEARGPVGWLPCPT